MNKQTIDLLNKALNPVVTDSMALIMDLVAARAVNATTLVEAVHLEIKGSFRERVVNNLNHGCEAVSGISWGTILDIVVEFSNSVEISMAMAGLGGCRTVEEAVQEFQAFVVEKLEGES